MDAVDVNPVDEGLATGEEAPATTEPFPPLAARVQRWWGRVSDRISKDPGRLLEGAVSVLAIAISTAIILATLDPKHLFSNSTPTGGDMGSHVWGPRYLIDHLLPNFRLTGWTPDWYNGFPAYQFYMVVPSLIVVAFHVGLPWYLAIPVVGLAAMVALSGWLRELLYPYRWALASLASLVVLVSVPLSYNRSFKLVTVLGLLALPLACWILAKAANLAFPIPPLAAAASLIFLYNREPLYNNTGNIIGGNFQSTMAGEFAFSVSLTLSVLYLAVAVRGLRTGRHRALAAVLFAAAGLCHLIPAFFVLACTAALFVIHPDRKRFRWLVTMVPVAGLLSAFWVLPFWWRRDYVNDMGWERLPLVTGEETSVWYYLLPGGLRYLTLLAVLGVLVSLLRRYSVGLVLAIAWVGVWVAFAVLPQQRLWNARLLPFMYLSMALLAAIGVGELLRVVGAAVSGNVKRPMRLVTVAGSWLSIVFVFIYTVLPMNGLLTAIIDREPVTNAAGESVTQSSLWFLRTTSLHPALGWSGNNYSGLEAKTAQPAGCDAPGSTVACTSGGWPEFKELVQTMAGIGESKEFGCGRSFWEYDGDRIGGYGTPMALMMLPYFTAGCIGSQEGLYFESSTTVPFHFIMQAELSTRPSQPQRDLPYPGFDIDAGVRHLQQLGVRYYLATSTNAVDQASRHPDLTEIAVTGAWHVFEVADADTVVPLAYEPVVATGIDESQHGWLPTASAWFRQPDDQVAIAAHGPDSWDRVDASPVPHDDRQLVRWVRDQLGQTGPIDTVPDLPRSALPAIEVTDIEMGNDRISFRVSEPGVPVLVKTSYFPNWEASGASGPYRVTPNLMVVIPTDNEVSLQFGRTPVDLLAAGLSLLGLVGLVLLARRPQVEVAPERPPRLSVALDRFLTISPYASVPVSPPNPFADPSPPPGEAPQPAVPSPEVDDDIWYSGPDEAGPPPDDR